MTSLKDLDYLSTEMVLNLEEKALLQNGIRGLEAAKKGEYRFWGKIFGTSADYLVVSALFSTPTSADTNHLDKQFYFCTNASFTLKPLNFNPSLHNNTKHNFVGNPETVIVEAAQGRSYSIEYSVQVCNKL